MLKLMKKKVAVLVVNPVNGSGLFQYLESFYENSIPFTTFAVAENTSVQSNSGVKLETNDVVANLTNRVDEFDAVVFACGDAMPKYAENANQPFNHDMQKALKAFNEKGKILIGHCAAALLFDSIGIGKGLKVAQHPYIKNIIKNCIATDDQFVVDGNIYTARTETDIQKLLPDVLSALR
jgi:putative intracellular protease/amidase